MKVKPVIFAGATRNKIKEFPRETQRALGAQLQAIQFGQNPSDWKPISSVGWGAKEIRIHDPHEFRVIYISHFSEAVYVLHAFEKKTQKTPLRHINTARHAYAEVQKQRQSSI